MAPAGGEPGPPAFANTPFPLLGEPLACRLGGGKRARLLDAPKDVVASSESFGMAARQLLRERKAWAAGRGGAPGRESYSCLLLWSLRCPPV